MCKVVRRRRRNRATPPPQPDDRGAASTGPELPADGEADVMERSRGALGAARPHRRRSPADAPSSAAYLLTPLVGGLLLTSARPPAVDASVNVGVRATTGHRTTPSSHDAVDIFAPRSGRRAAARRREGRRRWAARPSAPRTSSLERTGPRRMARGRRASAVASIPRRGCARADNETTYVAPRLRLHPTPPVVPHQRGGAGRGGARRRRRGPPDVSLYCHACWSELVTCR